MGSFWQKSAVHQPFLWLIPTSFFGWPTYSVSVEPSYNFSCIGGRFLQLKQSLNSPSNNPRSSSDHRLSVNIYNVGIILNVDRRHRWTFLQIVWWTADRIRILLTWTVYRSISGGQADDATLRTFSLLNWKNTREYRWIFSNCELVYEIGRLKIKLWLNDDRWSSDDHRLINIVTFEDIGAPKN